MLSQLQMAVANWLRRLAEETGAFSVAEVTTSARQRDTEWQPDLVAKLMPAGNRTPVRLEMEVKSRITPAEALGTLERMEAAKGRSAMVLCSPSISQRVTQLCRERGIGYLDEAGNCRIAAPGFFIQIEGRDSARPDTRPTVDVFAPKSSRIARVLLTSPKRGWQVQALAREAQISLGLASKTKRALVEQAFAEERVRLLYLRDPEQLLRAWSERYNSTKVRPVGLYALERPPKVEQRIGQWCKGAGKRYALTEFSAALLMAPMVRYNRSSVYFESPIEDMIAALGFKMVDMGANLLVWTPYDASVFYDLREINDLSVVSPIQAYLDLVGEPGRGEEAAREILEKKIKPTW